MEELWFDVERRYKTMNTRPTMQRHRLWFDVERRYKTIIYLRISANGELWFDVERRYKTISGVGDRLDDGCGLM